MSALDRLRNVKKQANDADETRDLYSKFIVAMREQGWTDEDVAEYAKNIGMLMGKDDSAALNLFPDGVYSTAQQARDSAKGFWRKFA